MEWSSFTHNTAHTKPGLCYLIRADKPNRLDDDTILHLTSSNKAAVALTDVMPGHR